MPQPALVGRSVEEEHQHLEDLQKESEAKPLAGGLADAGRGTLVLVLLASAANGLNQADRAIMPIAAIPMAEDFNWSMMEKGWVLSSFAIGYILSQLPSGWVSTRLAPMGVLCSAVLAWSCSTIFTPVAARIGFEALLLCRICMGVAEGFCLPAIFQLFSQRVPVGSRSRAFSLMIGCGGFGQQLALLACPSMVPWSHMFTTFGSAGLLWCAVCLVVLTGTSLAFPGGELDKEEVLTLCEPAATPGGSRSQDCEEGEEEAKLAASTPRAGGEASALCNCAICPPLGAICAAHFGQNWTNYVLAGWLPTYLHDVLQMPVKSLALTSVPFLAAALGGIAVGHAADAAMSRHWCDRLSVRRVATTIGLLGPAACHVLFLQTSTPFAALLVATLSYLLGATTSSGYMANHADITNRHAGLTFSISNTLATIPGIVAGPLTAALVKMPGYGWPSVFWLAAAINVACTCVYLVFARAHRVL